MELVDGNGKDLLHQILQCRRATWKIWSHRSEFKAKVSRYPRNILVLQSDPGLAGRVTFQCRLRGLFLAFRQDTSTSEAKYPVACWGYALPTRGTVSVGA